MNHKEAGRFWNASAESWAKLRIEPGLGVLKRNGMSMPCLWIS